jgi:chitinase
MMHYGCDPFRPLSWRRNISSWFAILVLPMCASPPLRAAASPVPAKQIIVYIFPQDRVIAPGEIAARKLPRINYAFANLQNGVVVEGFAHDAENLAALNSLKRENASLTVLGV